MRKIHLICNAHLDPVWLWQRTEGMAEAMATFRIAADFCEKYDGFVFNHNESVLYEWVLENDPELFERIKKLVKQGKWRIMAGWYLQPDVLMPNGESIIRQIKTGNEFFEKHFGKIPKTAIGFDAFGHSKGLVQILKKCGYDNYAYLRPREKECGPFIWRGFDGSEVTALKLYEWYNTPKGEALDRIKNYNKDFPNRELNAVTWGIGNHGGGPSEKDLNDINRFAEECTDAEIVHSDFDSYFNELDKSSLEVLDESITHCMVGCYTSMVRVKQAHRRLESRIAMCEKMLWQSGISYDKEKFNDAEKALLFCEFHDILPGSAIRRAEEDSLRLLGGGDEIIDKLIAKSFFRLTSGQKKAAEGEIPILIYNPHPYPIEEDFDVEFQLAEQNPPERGIFDVKVRDENGEYILSQLELADSVHPMDWRKKVVFRAVAKPMGITRFDCALQRDMDFVKIKPYTAENNKIHLTNEHLDVIINLVNGEIEKYFADGKNVINSIKLKAYKDGTDPWGMTVDSFSDCVGEFIAKGEARVIENGDIRTKIQTVLQFADSSAVMTYTFSKNSPYMDINVRLLSAQENVMYKLCIETGLDKSAKAYCQTMFGTEQSHKDGKESVFQKWCGLDDGENSVSVLNYGTYGGSFDGNEIRISLLRTPVYSAHPIDSSVELVLEDRAYDRIDMGERIFDFRLCVNEKFIDAEAESFNQKPYVLAMFPSGCGEKIEKPVSVDNRHIILTALKNTDNGSLARFYNSTSKKQSMNAVVGDESITAEFTPFEVKTFVISDGKIRETDMLGR